MKRYYLLLAAFFMLVITIGLAERRSRETRQVVPIAVALPQPTTEYHWGPIEIEPFLYAVPLGTFTPTDATVIYEWPGTQAPYVGTLQAGWAAAYTSEYRHEDEVWLCVKWEVDETIAAWNCSGWILAEMDGIPRGSIDRDWEAPEKHETSWGA